MNVRNSVVVLLALIFVEATLFSGEQQRAEKDEQAISDLIAEREQVLEKLVEVAKIKYQQGIASLDAVIAAERQLFDAKLDSATTPGERIAIRESQLKLAQQQEQLVANRIEAGLVSTNDLMMAKANRLTAQIQLLREKSSR